MQIKGTEPLLLISVYMQCKGIADNSADLMEVVDQLTDIMGRYSATHKVIIGGDLNEDLPASVSSSRMQYLKEFIGNHKLEVQITKPTFVNAKCEEVSTIDYFLYGHSLNGKILLVKRMDTVICNVSDHYPIILSV